MGHYINIIYSNVFNNLSYNYSDKYISIHIIYDNIISPTLYFYFEIMKSDY